MMDKQAKILEAAADIFSRYGVRRSTMGDIAKAAGMSRQSLYAAYDNKDDILAAVIDTLTTAKLEAARSEWSDCDTLEAQLAVYFRYMITDWFELIQTMPDSGDLVTGYNQIGKEALDRAGAAKSAALKELLTPYTAALYQSGLNPTDMAEMCFHASSGFKMSATDRPQLDRLLTTLTASILQLCQQKI